MTLAQPQTHLFITSPVEPDKPASLPSVSGVSAYIFRSDRHNPFEPGLAFCGTGQNGTDRTNTVGWEVAIRPAGWESTSFGQLGAQGNVGYGWMLATIMQGWDAMWTLAVQSGGQLLDIRLRYT